MKSLAEMLGWKRDTVRKAMDDLVDARWLAVRRYETASGTRAFEEYHLNASRKFTEEEAAEFNQTVVLPARQKGTPMPTKRATPCPLNGHPHAHETGTKEDHLEDYPEEQSENQAVELAPGDTWDNEPPFDIPDTSEDADWGMKEGTWEAWTEAQRQAERRRSAPVPPCSVPNTIEPETHCTAAECDQSPIPHGRYCYSHLDLVAAGG
jgi:hypothetical protein